MNIEGEGVAAGGEGAAAAAAAGGEGGGAKAWYADIEDAELRGLAEIKQWKDPGAALKSYQQLEKTIGVPPERLLKLPEKADDPAWGGIKEKLGFAAPAKAEDYGIPVPEGIDPGYAAKVSAKALELGIPKSMLLGLAEFQNKEMADMIAADQLAAQQKSDADIAALRTEWGEQFAPSSELARRAVTEYAALGKLDAESLNAMEGAMGTANFLRMWAAIGSKSAEAKFVDAGDAGARNFAMSPDAAKAKIAALVQDKEWGARKLAGGARENEEWATLHRIAYPEPAKS